ncbi:MAG: hypothetical protein IM557_07450, partial [Chitinophagaceae bacterium]|nr:hypothetical protein [Chitinophagaceae bacterium]
MTKLTTISTIFNNRLAKAAKVAVLLLSVLFFAVGAQAQYTGGNGDGHTTLEGSQDYSIPSIGAKVVTTCSGVSFSVSPTDGVNGDIVPANTTYTWLAPTGISGIEGLTGATSAAFFSATLTNTTNAPIIVTYIVTPASLSGTGATFTVTVTVNPTASVNPINLTTCSGVSFAVTPSSGTIPTGVSYTWSTPGITASLTGGATGSGTNITGLLTNTSASVQTATYTVTPNLTNGCTSAPFTLTVAVFPVASINNVSLTVCSGLNFNPTLIGTIPSGINYSWSPPTINGTLSGGVSGSNASGFSGSLNNTSGSVATATYFVRPNLTSGCSSSGFTVTVSVLPIPASVSNAALTTCSGVVFNYTPTGSNIPAGTSYSWGAPTYTGTLSGGTAGGGGSSFTGTLTNTSDVVATATYFVTPNVPGGCTSAGFTVTVTVFPIASISNLTFTVCSGFIYNQTFSGTIPAGTTYTVLNSNLSSGLSSGGGGLTTNGFTGVLNNTSNSIGTATYYLVPNVPGGCTSAGFTITISVFPVANIAATSLTTCTGVQFNLTPTGTPVPIGTTYSWGTPNMTSGVTNGVGASNASSFSGTLTNSSNSVGTATYFVIPNVPGSCSSNGFTVTVSVIPVAIANEINLTTCTGVPFSFSPVGTIPSGTAYSWSAPTGGASGESAASNQSNFNGTLTNTTNAVVTGTYFIRPTSSGCAGPGFTATVSVFPSAAINSISITTCSGISFTPSLSGRIPDNTSYSWSLPTGTSNLNGLAGATNATSFSGTLTNTSNATRTATYFVTPNVTGNCTSAVFSVFVTVFPSVSVNDIAFTTCSGVPFAFTPVSGTIPASTTYSWTAPSLSGTVGGTTGSGNGTNIFGNLTNTSSTISTATYTVTPNPGAGCANGATFTVTVTVLPLARINGITQVICSDGSINVDPVTIAGNIIPAGTRYTWTSPVADPPGSMLSSTALINQLTVTATLTNQTNSVATATYTITPVLTNGCTNSANFTIVVTVNPKVTIASALTTTICAGATFTVSPTNGGGNIVPANTTYTWTTANSPAGLTITTTGAGNAITGTISSTSAVPLSASFNVIPTPPTGQCGSAAFSVIVTVNPTANINQIFTTTCSGIPVVITPVDVTNGIVPANTRYNWTVSTVAGLSPLNGSGANTLSFSATINNTTNAPLTATYTVTPTSPQGNCVGSPFSITITVNPIARISGITAVVCSEGSFSVDPTSFANTIPNGTNYSWSAPASTGGLTWSAPLTGQTVISGTLSSTSNAVATATYTVTPVLLNGCTNSVNFTVVVTVNPRPYINAMTAVFCEGVGFTVTPAVGAPGINGIVPANTIFNWSAPDLSVGLTGGAAFSGTGVITGNLNNTTSTQQTAVYTVTPTAPAPGSCAGSPFTLTVTINPSAAISSMSTTVCSGLTFRVTPTDGTDGQVPTGASGTTTYTWSAPAATSIVGAVAQSPTGVSDIFGTLTNQTNIPRTITYFVTPRTSFTTGPNCVGSVFSVVVTVNPIVSITGITQVVCSEGSISFSPTNITHGIVPDGTTYELISASGSNPAVTWTSFASGSALITGTFSNTSNTAHSVTFNVRPILANTCSNSNNFTVVITVNPRPTITNMTTVTCDGVTFQLTPIEGTNGVVPANTLYRWLDLPTYTAGLSGGVTVSSSSNINGRLFNSTNTIQTATYQVVPRTQGGNCIGATFTVEVGVLPNAEISTLSETVCSGVPFNITPTDPVDGIIPANTTYTWTQLPTGVAISGGAVASNVSSIFGTLISGSAIVRTATFSVTPTSPGGCTGSAFSVVINVRPFAYINAMTRIFCDGVPFTITPTHQVDGVIAQNTSFNWTVLDGGGLSGVNAGSGTSLTATLSNPGATQRTAVYQFTPVVPNCGNGLPFTVTVTINPNAEIVPFTTTICAGLTFSVTPTASNVVPTGTTYAWSAPTVNGFSGGAAASGQNTITGNLLNSTNEERTATYNVTPTSPGGCSGAQFSVTVTLLPIARVTNMTAVICSENTFTVTPTTGVGINLIPVGTSFTWGAPVSTGSLTWSAAPLSATSVFGTISSTSNTVQTATYLVNSNLVNGCLNSSNFSVTVTVNPRPYINAMTAVSCEGVTFSITPAVGQPGVNGIVPLNTFYSWSAPEVTGSMSGGVAFSRTGSITGNLSNPTSTQQTAVYTVTPTAPAPGSCPGAPFTLTITINPNAAITTLSTTVCNGLTFRITPTDVQDGQVPTGSSGTTTYTWSAPNATGITGTAGQSGVPNIFGTLTNTTNIVRSITYFVTPTTTYPLGGSACAGAVFSVVVTVNPSAVINSMTAVACTGTPFSASPTNGINGIVPAGTLYSWSAPTTPNTLSGYAGGTNLTIITGNLLNSTNAPVTVTYFVTPTSSLCGDNVVFSVVVTIAPTPVIASTSTIVCGLAPFVFTPTNGVEMNVVPVGTTYAWSGIGGTGFTVMLGGTRNETGALNVYGRFGNLVNTARVATFVVTPTFSYTSPTIGSCIGNPFTLTVNINPAAQINPFTAVVCSGETFEYSPSNTNNGIVPIGTTYAWGLPVTNTTFTGVATGTGAASFSGTLTSPVNIQRTATYTITPTSAGCLGTAFTAVITVNPRAVINAMTAVTCSGTPFVVTPTDVVNGIVPANTTYAWTAVPTVTGGITGGQTRTNQSNLNGLLDNPTNTIQTAVYIVTPTVPTNCGAGNSFTLTVTVNPTASINNFTRVVCNGEPFMVSPTTADGRLPDNTTYSWSVSVTNSAITGLAGASNMSYISGTPINISNQIQTATYTVTPRSPLGSCNGAVFTITVTVNPSAVINSMTAVACSGAPFVATPTTGSNGIVPIGTVYRWDAPSSVPGISSGLVSGLSATNISGTLINTTNASITVTYFVTPTSPLCGDDAVFSLVATIAPVPAISSTTISTCALVTFATTPTNGSYNGTAGNIVPSTTLYSWTASGANILGLTSVNNSSNISGTLTNQVNTPLTATYFVTPSASYSSPIAGSCPGSPFTLTVSLNPAAQITPLSQTICTGSPFEISPVNNNNNIIVPANTTYSWSAPAVSGSITGGLAAANAISISATILSHSRNTVQTAVYSVTPRSAIGNCQGATLTVTVFVNPRPVVNPISLSVCSGVVFTFTPANTTNGIIPSNIRYRWESVPTFTESVTGGATATARTNITGQLLNQTNVIQTVTYTVIPSTVECGDGNPFTVTVTLHPTPVISAITTVVCHGLGFTISPTAANGIVPNGTTYSWPLPIATGGVTGTGAGTNLTFISATALLNPTNSQQSVTYSITPRAPVTGCQGTPFALTVTVNPNARINTFTLTTCSGVQFQVSPVNGLNGNIVPIGTTYTWTLPAVSASVTGGESSTNPQSFFSGRLVNLTNAAETATYTVTPIAPLCSNSNSFTVVIIVDRGLAINTIFTTVCSGIQFRLTPTDPLNGFVLPNTTYNWSAPSGTGFSGGQSYAMSSTNIFGTLTNDTNGVVTAIYDVTANTANCGPVGMFSFVVTLRPIATINPITVTTCSGTPFQVSPANGVNGNIVPMSTTYSWGLPTVSPG